MDLASYPPIDYPAGIKFPHLSDNRAWDARAARKRAQWLGTVLEARVALLLGQLRVDDSGTSEECIAEAGRALGELLLKNPDKLLWRPRDKDLVVVVRDHHVVVAEVGDPDLTFLGDTMATDMGLLLCREFLKLGRELKWTIQKKGGKRGEDYNAAGVDGFPGFYSFFNPDKQSRVQAYQVLQKGLPEADGWLAGFKWWRDKRE